MSFLATLVLAATTIESVSRRTRISAVLVLVLAVVVIGGFLAVALTRPAGRGR